MSTIAGVVDSVAVEILDRLRAGGFDAASFELAERLLRDLVAALRAGDLQPPAVVAHGLSSTLRELERHVVDAIEARLPTPPAREMWFVARWFAAASVQALEDDNRRFVAMLDAVPDHLILLDRDARVRFLNAPTAAITSFLVGIPREQVYGRFIGDLPQPEAHKQHLRDLIARACRGEPTTEEFLLPVPDRAVWHEQHVTPVYGLDGNVEGVAIASRDIHARKQAEARLRLLSKIGMLAETTAYQDVLARAASLAIPELADWAVFQLVESNRIRRGTIVHPDPERAARAQEMLDPLERELEGPQAACIYRIADDAAALQARDPGLYELLRRFEATTAIVVPFVVLGAPIAVATFAFGPESNRGHSEADLAIAVEVARRAAQIVENVRLHEEVAQALAFRERVMGILGHDLRNPIGAVLSLASTFAQREDIPERVRLGMHHIRQSAERMERMIRTILDFTQLRFRGAPALTLEVFDLDSLACTIVDELRAAHPDRGITVDARGELRGRWDLTGLGQVIANLVGNALTHGERASGVDVSLSNDDHGVVMAVSNRGATIAPDALSKLFEPFWQGGSNGNGRSGLGLGLYIAQQIVSAHGGAIDVQSRDDTTTFTVRLPR